MLGIAAELPTGDACASIENFNTRAVDTILLPECCVGKAIC